MKVTLIHNPKAGPASVPDAQELLAAIRRAGHDVVYESVPDGEWKTRLREPTDLIAVAGGDGIVGQVARLCLNRGVPLTVLPMGTANNISKTLGLMHVPLEELIGAWENGQRQVFDVGVADGPWGRGYFLEGLGTGIFGTVLLRLEQGWDAEPIDSEDRHEELQAARKLLREHLHDFPGHFLKVRLDGQDLSGQYLLLEAMNIRLIGPNLAVAPAADPGDGLLDVALVAEAERDKLIAYLTDEPKHGASVSALPVHKGTHLEVEGQELHVHLDDRVWPEGGAEGSRGAVRIDVKVVGRALEFLVPRLYGAGRPL